MKYLAMATKLHEITRILFSILAFSLIVAITVIMIKHFVRYPLNLLRKCSTFCRLRRFNSLSTVEHPDTDHSEAHSAIAAQPLILPTSSEMSYGYTVA